jgi:hypothetical protein
MSKETFGPAGDKIPKGATQAVLVGQASPMLGQQHIPSHTNAAASAPARTAQLSPAATPRGAQQVPLAGMTPPRAEAPATFVAARPQMAGSAPAADDGVAHTIRVEGLGADGRRYKAEFDAVFPRGTKIVNLGVVE